MPIHGKRLSILSLPEVQDVYSVPKFDAQEQTLYLTFTDEELAVANSIRLLKYWVHYTTLFMTPKESGSSILIRLLSMSATNKYFPLDSRERLCG